MEPNLNSAPDVSAVGNPTKSSLLEQAMAFVTASPQSGVVPQNNGTDFADIAPLQLEGTKTVNVRFGATAAVPPAAAPPAAAPAPAAPGGSLPATGAGTALPLAAVLLVLTGLGIARRRRTS